MYLGKQSVVKKGIQTSINSLTQIQGRGKLIYTRSELRMTKIFLQHIYVVIIWFDFVHI